uniref:Uncharacterized protein n=1 Tax=Rhizochromulina marina TaxID=1034831 RepID=A0A7S2S4S1_9STRA|mmetsp:Transcript_25092/g.73304  ORF Transcript_25092/g.73304 Transcript_25092/m.73304 type:complete len:253 (+) Transcript_25092:54-812(+)
MRVLGGRQRWGSAAAVTTAAACLWCCPLLPAGTALPVQRHVSTPSPSTHGPPRGRVSGLEAHVFCDLDGVLADFERGVEAVTGRPVNAYNRRSDMWARLARTEGFYSHLPWMEDGRELWEAIKCLKPTILTGLPRGGWAHSQKLDWCRRELGPEVPVITCFASDKFRHLRGQGDLLIDDLWRAKEPWEGSGGLFVHHTSTDNTLSCLESLGLWGQVGPPRSDEPERDEEYFKRLSSAHTHRHLPTVCQNGSH